MARRSCCACRTAPGSALILGKRSSSAREQRKRMTVLAVGTSRAHRASTLGAAREGFRVSGDRRPEVAPPQLLTDPPDVVLLDVLLSADGIGCRQLSKRSGADHHGHAKGARSTPSSDSRSVPTTSTAVPPPRAGRMRAAAGPRRVGKRPEARWRWARSHPTSTGDGARRSLAAAEGSSCCIAQRRTRAPRITADDRGVGARPRRRHQDQTQHISACARISWTPPPLPHRHHPRLG